MLVPVKAGDRAKSRLDVAPAVRRRLAAAMARDTVETIRSCSAVSSVTVLTADAPPPGLAADRLLVEPDGGDGTTLNDRLRWAIARLDATAPLAVVVADLPALTTATLTDVLRVATEHDRGVVVDRRGSGTTMLTALAAAAVDPAFGPGSAAAHAARGASVVDAAPEARCDVDDLSDLAHARALGVGPRTARVLEQSAATWLRCPP